MASSFEPLQLIGEDIYWCEPPGKKSDNPCGSPAPALVILCTWAGGATPRRINKYIDQYLKVYPSSSLLLLTTNIPNTAFRPFRWIRHRLKPARLAIRRILTPAVGDEPKDKDTANQLGGILLHMFSHGGCSMGVQLSLAMREEPDIGESFRSSLRGIILDCSPGDDAFERSYRAARLSLPQTAFVNLFSITLLYPTLSVLNRLQNAGVLRAVRDLRISLNDPDTFGPNAKRLYIYSKEDVMVGWEEVQSHFEEAKSQGHVADQVVFETGSHCTLMVEDADRYWTAIQRFWEGGDISDLTFDQDPSGIISISRDKPHLRSRL